jgi:hypothetical protein
VIFVSTVQVEAPNVWLLAEILVYQEVLPANSKADSGLFITVQLITSELKVVLIFLITQWNFRPKALLNNGIVNQIYKTMVLIKNVWIDFLLIVVCVWVVSFELYGISAYHPTLLGSSCLNIVSIVCQLNIDYVVVSAEAEMKPICLHF